MGASNPRLTIYCQGLGYNVAMSEDTITLVAALAFSVIGVGAFFHYFLMVGSWPRAVGYVVGNVTDMRSDEGFDYAYFPRIEFAAADGKTYDVKGDVGLSQEWPLGQAVALRYRRSNPNHISIAKGWQRLLFAAVFLGFAAGCWAALLG